MNCIRELTGRPRAHELCQIAELVASEPDWTGRVVGVNLLGLSTIEAISRDESGGRSWPMFGGVAFKYRAVVPAERWGGGGDVARAAVDRGVDVVTTSGDRTGEPPPVAKVRVMREAIGEHALAVASGVDLDNVGGLLPYVDAFLVASSLERSHGGLDASAVHELADIVHGWTSVG